MEQNTEIAVRTEAHMVVAQANALVIKDNETYVSACEFENIIKETIKKAKAFFDPLVDAAHKAHKLASDRRKTVLDPLEDAYKTRKRIRIAWEDEQERIRQAEQKRLEEEARKAEEERKAKELAELEEARKAHEAEVLKAAAEAEKSGDMAKAEILISQAVEVNEQTAQYAQSVKEAPVYVAPVVLASTKPKVAGTTAAQTRWDFKIKPGAENPLAWLMMLVDNPKLPTTEKIPQIREELKALNGYVQWNETAVRKVVTALKDQARIPGIEPYPKRV